ncbi:VOC family protein, partial [Nocardia salmonicida]|uniref:VOC family protein n=1 Tax=Nocardia salmonicida TaxID=53431 RepID=UPI0036593678
MSRRAFPLVFAKDVQASAFFYQRFGFVRHAQNPPTGEPTFVGLRRDDAEIAVVDLHWPRERYAGTVGESPRFEFFVFVDDVDATLAELEETGIQTTRPTATCWAPPCAAPATRWWRRRTARRVWP